MTNPHLTAEHLTKMGYRRVSNRYKTVSRIDRKDWQQAMIDNGLSHILSMPNNAPDWYRRCLSQDKISGLPQTVFDAIPASGFDKTGFIMEDGTPHPGYRLVLVEEGTG